MKQTNSDAMVLHELARLRADLEANRALLRANEANQSQLKANEIRL